MFGELVPLLSHRLAPLAPRPSKARDLLQRDPLLAVSQLMQSLLYPRRSARLILAETSAPQAPHVLAAMIEVQKLPGLGPAISCQIPNPGDPIAQN